ncbi:group 1 truncated hemoglobin [Planosporangium thailandense]|uniref:Group 1 truncated hemoglobin n=1 Tax=Planosporangium thailandense TaxID=765197 RepID=A0ABX0Y0V8_9ACTN|nr:group 1 truncated hemoglobin [Planosporangium thailandense]NJC71985.1 group 1 truncated hemoglobin [Planosporangium thailandense]
MLLIEEVKYSNRRRVMSTPGYPAQSLSPYERVGGVKAIQSVVDHLYFLIMRDEQVKRYFNQAYLPSVKAHMVKLLSQLLGGPREYTGRELDDAHRHLCIEPEHYARVGRYVLASLLVHHVPEDIVEVVKDVLVAHEEVIVAAPRTGVGWSV